MEKVVRMGIIGIGNMGTCHACNIKDGRCPEIELAAVADINPKRLDWAKENLPDTVARFDDAIKMLDSGLIDAFIIAVPHYLHPQFAIEGFKRGLHVMCEKPAGVYTKQVREMNKAAAESNVKFGMMFNQRTDHIYRKMKEIMASGELGELKRTSWNQSPTGTALRAIMTADHGERLGAVMAEEFCLINALTTLIFGSGFSVCLTVLPLFAPAENTTTLPLRTTRKSMQNTKTAQPLPLSHRPANIPEQTVWKSPATKESWLLKTGCLNSGHCLYLRESSASQMTGAICPHLNIQSSLRLKMTALTSEFCKTSQMPFYSVKN